MFNGREFGKQLEIERGWFSEVYDLFGDVVRCFVYTTMFSSHGFTGDISRQQKKALKGPRKT